MPDARRPAQAILTAAFLAATFMSTPVFAQAIDTTRIGAINLSYVARMSRAGREGLSRIDDATRKKGLEIEARAAELQKQQIDFQASSIGLSARAIADLQRTFEKSRVDFDRFKQDAQKEIEAMQATFEMEFRARLAPVIDHVSKEKGLQFVFGLEEAAIVWWNPSLDISDDVVRRLDAPQ
jgi:outer membrane protein